jgi:jasmonate ZIM domain-containing protein
MERDFLGAIGRKDEEEDAEAAATARAEPSDYPGGAQGMQWQFPVKAGAAPAFMSFRSAREGDSDHFSFSGFRQPPASPGDAFDGIKNQASPVMRHHQQRQFGFDGHVSPQQYATAAHGHRAQVMDSYGAAAHHLLGGSRPFCHPVPSNPGNPILRVQSLPSVAGGGTFKNQCFNMSNAVAGSTVGLYGPRDLRNPKSTQMTIFYDGSVNVFDIPVEKAQELMLLASRASIPSTPSPAHRSDSPISATAKFAAPEVLPARQIIIQKPEPSVPHASGISSPIITMSQAVTLSKSTSSSNNDTAGPNLQACHQLFLQ